MTEKLGRLPNEEETEQARAVAMELVESLRTAPTVSIGICGIGMFVAQAFKHAVKAEYLLQGFDQWSAAIRTELEEDVRRAHN